MEAVPDEGPGLDGEEPQGDMEVGSPMSPDQSNYQEKYRSPEAVDPDQEMMEDTERMESDTGPVDTAENSDAEPVGMSDDEKGDGKDAVSEENMSGTDDDLEEISMRGLGSEVLNETSGGVDNEVSGNTVGDIDESDMTVISLSPHHVSSTSNEKVSIGYEGDLEEEKSGLNEGISTNDGVIEEKSSELDYSFGDADKLVDSNQRIESDAGRQEYSRNEPTEDSDLNLNETSENLSKCTSSRETEPDAAVGDVENTNEEISSTKDIVADKLDTNTDRHDIDTDRNLADTDDDGVNTDRNDAEVLGKSDCQTSSNAEPAHMGEGHIPMEMGEHEPDSNQESVDDVSDPQKGDDPASAVSADESSEERDVSSGKSDTETVSENRTAIEELDEDNLDLGADKSSDTSENEDTSIETQSKEKDVEASRKEGDSCTETKGRDMSIENKTEDMSVEMKPKDLESSIEVKDEDLHIETKSNDVDTSVEKEETVDKDDQEDSDDEVESGEVSEESGVEEISEEEGEEAAAESGIEEVSDEEEEDVIKEGASGVEEVSDEEMSDADEDMEEGEMKEKRVVKSAADKGGAGNLAGAGSGVEEVSDEEEEVEEEEEEQSGVEEVSEEEEEVEESEEEEVEEVTEEEEEEEEVEEEVSADESVEEVTSDEGDMDSSKKVVTQSARDNKHDDDEVDVNDEGKDDTTIVREVLEKITLKIDRVNSNIEKSKPETKVPKEGRIKTVRSKSKPKPSKEVKRRESVKSRNSSTGGRDSRDINERLKAQASYDLELDYDDVHEDAKDKQGSEDGALATDSESDDGELPDEEDCEEGEIREPGSKPFIKPTCRFFMRGHCTWGINCRFLHPGVNDKGNYQLIERPGFNNKPPPPYEEQWEEEERSPSPEPPPAPPEPKEETAWERGLRQAKELRKKALERRELEPNFEHKKLNLSIEENPEFNKENTLDEKERSPVKVKKSSYYDKLEPLSDDEYYDQTPIRLQQKQQTEQSWGPGQYENFEVRWTRGGGDSHFTPTPPPHQPSHYQMHPMHRYPPHQYPHPDQPGFRGRDRYPQPRPSGRNLSPSPPPIHYQRYIPQQKDMRGIDPRREKMRERMRSPPSQKRPIPSSPGGRPSKIKADEWHDPWRRSNVPKNKSPEKKRSRSRGRRRSRRSHSYSSSYSSSSYSSSRSRSRSSSYSSVSSRSHSRSSSVSSRSMSPRPNQARGRRGQRQPMAFQNSRRPPPPMQRQNSEAMRASMAMRGRPGRSPPMKRPGMPQSPTKVSRMAGVPSRAMMGSQVGDMGRGRKPEKPPVQPPQRKIQMEVKARDRPLPPSALSKDRRRSGRAASSSSSRSRSHSSSSSSSSYSSRSSRSSSSSSSGSADSDHLYRNIGSRDNQRGAGPRGMPSRVSRDGLPSRDAQKAGLQRNISRDGPKALPQRGKPADKGKRKSPIPERRPLPGRQLSSGKQGLPGKPSGKPSGKPTSRPMTVREGEFGKALSAQPQKAKDPMKMTGQKSNIKLTLIKPSDKSQDGSSSGKKRPAEGMGDAPPPKRSVVQTQLKTDKLMKKAVPTSPVKAAPAASKGGMASAVATAPVKKKSTVLRREELLKQLKAVEDAIAKKKKKMN